LLVNGFERFALAAGGEFAGFGAGFGAVSTRPGWGGSDRSAVE